MTRFEIIQLAVAALVITGLFVLIGRDLRHRPRDEPPPDVVPEGLGATASLGLQTVLALAAPLAVVLAFGLALGFRKNRPVEDVSLGSEIAHTLSSAKRSAEAHGGAGPGPPAALDDATPTGNDPLLSDCDGEVISIDGFEWCQKP